MIDQDGVGGRTYRGFRSVMDVTMGVVYIAAGCFGFYGTTQGMLNYNKSLAYIISALILIYGVFRIYRGIKEINFSNKRNTDS